MTDDKPPAGSWQTRLEAVDWLRVARILGFLVLILVVLPFVVYAIPQVVGAEASYVVVSGSMQPAINPGDVIIVDAVDPDEIQVGDVLTFQTGADRPTTHRVIEVDQQNGERRFITKGDNNEDADPRPIASDAVIGSVMQLGGFLVVFPFLGHVIRFANTQLGLFVLFFLPVTLFVLNEAYKIGVSARSGAAAAPPNEVAERDPADGTDDGGEAKTEGGLALSATELQLGIGIAATFVAYSIWVAYATREVWAFGVAAAVATGFVILLGLYVLGGSSPAADSDDADEEPAEPVDSVESGADEEAADADGIGDEGPPADQAETAPTAADGSGPTESDTADGSEHATGSETP